MKSLKFFFLLLLPFLTSGQNVKGFIYDNETTVKGAKIINRTQNILAYSDDKGAFEIEAKENDVLVVNSYFHDQKFVNITKSSFDEDIVIVLNKITNELDTVEVTKINEKVFDSIIYEAEINNQISTDIKNRSYLYGVQSNGNMDFVAIARLIGSLFKKKKRDPQIIYVTSKDLITFFETNTYFNQKYLVSQLDIPKPYQQLFFDYCTAQQMNITLLEKANEFMLVDTLLTHSEAFKNILKAHVKD